MKKIGFVDYYISEWHANNYPKWIKEQNEKIGADFEVAYAYAERDISPVDNRTTDEWCEAFGVKKCDTVSELCEKSDYIIILAPSNPEKHLGYAKAVLPYGKPTYIDKTFTEDLAVADEIFKIAEEYGTPFFSTSALRYANELDGLSDVKNLIVTGGGSSLDEYVVHQAEMAVKLLKDSIASAEAVCQGAQRIIHLVTEGGKKASLIYSPALSFSVTAESSGGTSVYRPITSEFFPALISDILRFFDDKTVSFDISELREVMRMRDMVLNAVEAAK